MRVVVLGASGLIGHKLFINLGERFGDVYGTLHSSRSRFAPFAIFDDRRTIENIDVRDFEKLTGILNDLKPEAVLNCAGITKRRPQINSPIDAIAVNALFPHQLAGWARQAGVRVIHFSTDCVFDGATGNYTEDSPTTARDPYGQTKALGEIRYDHTLAIRSSFIGRELSEFSELLEWFLAQDGKTIKGFTKAWYSGVSTTVMSGIVGDILERHSRLHGLYQLSTPAPISKYDLLCLARDAFSVDVEIVPDADFVSRPTLDGARLRHAMNLDIPAWPEMMQQLATEDLYARAGR